MKRNSYSVYKATGEYYAAKPYQPKTGATCHCKRGQHRDNCPDCEGTGMRIDFRAIRERSAKP